MLMQPALQIKRAVLMPRIHIYNPSLDRRIPTARVTMINAIMNVDAEKPGGLDGLGLMVIVGVTVMTGVVPCTGEREKVRNVSSPKSTDAT